MGHHNSSLLKSLCPFFPVLTHHQAPVQWWLFYIFVTAPPYLEVAVSTLAPYYHDKVFINHPDRQCLKACPCIMPCVCGQLDSFMDPIWTPWSTAAPDSAFADGVWAALLVWGQLALVGLWGLTCLGSQPRVPHILQPNMHAIMVSSEDSEESRNDHVGEHMKIHMYVDVLCCCC